MITKLCGNCGTAFESEPHHNKVYCTHSCYQRAKTKRRIARDIQDKPPNEIDSRLLSTLRLPSEEQLNMFAQLVTEDRPVKVIGMNRMWTPPESVVFVKQPEREENQDVWIMLKHVPDIMDAFK